MNEKLIIILAVVSNIISVVGIVICNKYIVDVDGYNFMVFLSFLHFAFTSFGTRLLLSFNVYQYKSAAYSGVLPVALVSIQVNIQFLRMYFPLIREVYSR